MKFNLKDIWFCKLYHRKVEVYDYSVSDFPIKTEWTPVCLYVYKDTTWQEFLGEDAKQAYKVYLEKYGNKQTSHFRSRISPLTGGRFTRGRNKNNRKS